MPHGGSPRNSPALHSIVDQNGPDLRCQTGRVRPGTRTGTGRSLAPSPAANPLGSRWAWGGDPATVARSSSGSCHHSLPRARGRGEGVHGFTETWQPHTSLARSMELKKTRINSCLLRVLCSDTADCSTVRLFANHCQTWQLLFAADGVQSSHPLLKDGDVLDAVRQGRAWHLPRNPIGSGLMSTNERASRE
jgi:hypothetical protein